MDEQNKWGGAAATAPAPTSAEADATQRASQRSSARRRSATGPTYWDMRATLLNAAHKRLNRAEALVLMMLCGRAKPDGVAWPHVANIVEVTGVHERNVRKALRQLERHRLLVIEERRRGQTYPNGRPVRASQALVFHIQQGTNLRAVEAPTPLAVAPGYPLAVAPGYPLAVAPGYPLAVAPGTPWLCDQGSSLGTKSGNEISPERDFQGTGTSARALTGPRGLRAPAREPTALRASHPAGVPEPEGMVDAPAGASEPRGVGDRAGTSPEELAPQAAAAHAAGVREATGPSDPDRPPTPPTSEPRRSRTKESTTRAARAVLAYWARRFGVRAPIHTTPRLDVVRSWLRNGIAADELGAAVHAASVNEWYRSGERWRISFVLRTEKVIRDLADAGRGAGFRRLPRPVALAGPSSATRSDSRAGSGPANGRELLDTPVNESLQYLTRAQALAAAIGVSFGREAEKGVDQ